jgi:hypothetical protein
MEWALKPQPSICFLCKREYMVIIYRKVTSQHKDWLLFNIYNLLAGWPETFQMRVEEAGEGASYVRPLGRKNPIWFMQIRVIRAEVKS